MKKLLGVLILGLLLSGSAQANWKGSIKKNEFDGKTRKLLSGSFIKPGIPLGYPFEELSMFPQLNSDVLSFKYLPSTKCTSV